MKYKLITETKSLNENHCNKYLQIVKILSNRKFRQLRFQSSLKIYN